MLTFLSSWKLYTTVNVITNNHYLTTIPFNIMASDLVSYLLTTGELAYIHNDLCSLSRTVLWLSVFRLINNTLIRIFGEKEETNFYEYYKNRYGILKYWNSDIEPSSVTLCKTRWLNSFHLIPRKIRQIIPCIVIYM